MTHSAHNAVHDGSPRAPFRISAGATIALVLAAWFALAATIGITGLATAGPDQLFRPVLITVIVPLAAFLALYAGSPAFRDFVLTRDMRVVTMLQSWRVVGFAFLMLYAHGVLPGLFAWPAGLGDVAIGLSAPFVVLALTRDPGFAHSRRFVVWHLLGLLDFVVAAGTATLVSGALPDLVAGSVTSAAMEVWPLSLFPSFIVPLFVILHLTVLFQVRALRRAAASEN